jgi:hypothetical protein
MLSSAHMQRSSACLLVALVSLHAAPAFAQPAAPAPRRFELEAYGALGRMLDAGSATVSFPAAGAPITTSSPLAPSRRVSSWMFGDGSTLLNGALAQLDLTARIVPLDAAIGTVGRSAEHLNSMGVRLRYRTAPAVSLELAVDATSRSRGVPDSLLAAAESTRASFVTSFTELLASGPFTDRTVTATSTGDTGGWREITSTIAANIEIGHIRAVTPYVTIGGGFIERTGAQPAISVTGRYTARILGAVPIDETDSVTVRGAARNAPALVGGLGLATSPSRRIVLRVDARFVAANRTIGAELDASPVVATGTPADYIESFTNPSVQFSNNISTGRRSTLSGDTLTGLEVARSTRLQSRALVTIGLGIRF